MEVVLGDCCDDLERSGERRRMDARSPKILLLLCQRQHQCAGACAKVKDVAG